MNFKWLKNHFIDFINLSGGSDEIPRVNQPGKQSLHVCEAAKLTYEVWLIASLRIQPRFLIPTLLSRYSLLYISPARFV